MARCAAFSKQPVCLDGFDGIGRCRHAVMTMNAEDLRRGGLSRRTRLGLGTLFECHCIDMSQG